MAVDWRKLTGVPTNTQNQSMGTAPVQSQTGYGTSKNFYQNQIADEKKKQDEIRMQQLFNNLNKSGIDSAPSTQNVWSNRTQADYGQMQPKNNIGFWDKLSMGAKAANAISNYVSPAYQRDKEQAMTTLDYLGRPLNALNAAQMADTKGGDPTLNAVKLFNPMNAVQSVINNLPAATQGLKREGDYQNVTFDDLLTNVVGEQQPLSEGYNLFGTKGALDARDVYSFATDMFVRDPANLATLGLAPAINIARRVPTAARAAIDAATSTPTSALNSGFGLQGQRAYDAFVDSMRQSADTGANPGGAAGAADDVVFSENAQRINDVLSSPEKLNDILTPNIVRGQQMPSTTLNVGKVAQLLFGNKNKTIETKRVLEELVEKGVLTRSASGSYQTKTAQLIDEAVSPAPVNEVSQTKSLDEALPFWMDFMEKNNTMPSVDDFVNAGFKEADYPAFKKEIEKGLASATALNASDVVKDGVTQAKEYILNKPNKYNEQAVRRLLSETSTEQPRRPGNIKMAEVDEVIELLKKDGYFTETPVPASTAVRAEDVGTVVNGESQPFVSQLDTPESTSQKPNKPPTPDEPRKQYLQALADVKKALEDGQGTSFSKKNIEFFLTKREGASYGLSDQEFESLLQDLVTNGYLTGRYIPTSKYRNMTPQESTKPQSSAVNAEDVTTPQSETTSSAVPKEKPKPTPTEKPKPTPTEKPEPTPTEKPEPTPTEKPKPTSTAVGAENTTKPLANKDELVNNAVQSILKRKEKVTIKSLEKELNITKEEAKVIKRELVDKGIVNNYGDPVNKNTPTAVDGPFTDFGNSKDTTTTTTTTSQKPKPKPKPQENATKPPIQTPTAIPMQKPTYKPTQSEVDKIKEQLKKLEDKKDSDEYKQLSKKYKELLKKSKEKKDKQDRLQNSLKEYNNNQASDEEIIKEIRNKDEGMSDEEKANYLERKEGVDKLRESKKIVEKPKKEDNKVQKAVNFVNNLTTKLGDKLNKNAKYNTTGKPTTIEYENPRIEMYSQEIAEAKRKLEKAKKELAEAERDGVDVDSDKFLDLQNDVERYKEEVINLQDALDDLTKNDATIKEKVMKKPPSPARYIAPLITAGGTAGLLFTGLDAQNDFDKRSSEQKQQNLKDAWDKATEGRTNLTNRMLKNSPQSYEDISQENTPKRLANPSSDYEARLRDNTKYTQDKITRTPEYQQAVQEVIEVMQTDPEIAQMFVTVDASGNRIFNEALFNEYYQEYLQEQGGN
jgi:hypothetical protein